MNDPGAPNESTLRQRPTRVRWVIFVLACAASWLLYLHRYAWGVMKPSFHAENPELDDIAIGWLDSAFQAAYALGQVPGGMAGDRFGPRAMLSLLTLCGSLAVAGVAFVGGFWPFAGTRAVFGLAQAGVYPIVSKMTRTWFPLATRTSVQGFVTALGRIGAATAPIVIATVLMGMLGLTWQTTLIVLIVPGVVLAVAFWFIVRDTPREHPWVNAAECAEIADRLPTSLADDSIRAGEPPIVRKPGLTLKGVASVSVAMMLLYAFASTFQDQFYVYWLPSFLKDGHDFDLKEMGLFAALPLLGGALGGVIGGMLNDLLIRRWGNRRWSRALVALTGKTLAAGLVLVSVQMAEGHIALLVLVAARVFGDWSLPTQWAAVTDMGGRASATLFGLVNTIGAVGGFAANPIFGYLKREYDWPGVFAGVAAMCLLAAATWLFIDCTKKVVDD